MRWVYYALAGQLKNAGSLLCQKVLIIGDLITLRKKFNIDIPYKSAPNAFGINSANEADQR